MSPVTHTGKKEAPLVEITEISSQHCNISHSPDLKGNNGCDLRISCSVGVTLILFSVAYPCAIRNVLNFPKSQIGTTHKCRYPCNLLPMWKGFSPCSSPQYLHVFITHPWTAGYPQHGCGRSLVFPLDGQ